MRRAVNMCLFFSSLVVSLAAASAAGEETSAGWIKHDKPVLGGQYGTCFDISVLREGDKYRMWVSWRPKASVALVESRDGIHWSAPQIVLGPRKETGWENDINRPVVVKRGATYHMWYTGQAKGRSAIGYATSPDGIAWKRMSDKPVLAAEKPWEKVAVMCPHVLWDTDVKGDGPVFVDPLRGYPAKIGTVPTRAGCYRMWYSAGEQYEPNAIGYATSRDGLHWTRKQDTPVFVPDAASSWEKHKVTACQVVRQGDWYVMFYIGFRDENTAQIGIARSRDGITAWQRHAANPIIRVSQGKWDQDACYKPYAIFDGRRWLLWYNGRRGSLEQIGLAIHEGADLGF